MTIFDTTTVRYSGIETGTELQAAVETREQVLLMTQQAEEAVLRPADVGAWSCSLRAALAARIARQNALLELASYYSAAIDDATVIDIADPAYTGLGTQFETVLAFMDSVAIKPREITAADIQGLQNGSVSDADIVRLTELNAFLAYQVRVIAGLQLLTGHSA